MVTDPVCNMKIDEKRANSNYEYKGTKYYFCSEGCRNEFVKNPEKYIKAGKK